MIGMDNLKTMLIKERYSKKLMLFYDIETYQYNEERGKEKPSEYRNWVFSVAVSWLDGSTVKHERFKTFKDFFDVILNVYGGIKSSPTIILNAHNGNKYDHHYLRRDLLLMCDEMTIENYYLMTASFDEVNDDAMRLKDLTNEQKYKGVILEKRIKSKINLEMIFFIKNIQFETMDNWVKTNTSLKNLGHKLKRLGVIDAGELKTDFDYLKYNLQENLTDDEAINYASYIYDNLTDDELTYIDNDVIILAKSVYYYSEIFKGFDYNKMTFTSNILESYNTNNLTSFQLLNRIGKGKDKFEIRYTDYEFTGENFYNYLRPFYRGGLNFYNQLFVGRKVYDVFSIDIKSSYPNSMYGFKIPTFLKSHDSYSVPTMIDVTISDDEYFLYRMSKHDFDRLLDKLDSVIVRQLLVKYYSTNDYININSYTLKLLHDVFDVEINQLKVISYLSFETEYFGSREKIAEYYYIKEQSKHKKKLDFKSPYDMKLTDEANDLIYTSEEIDLTKVNLNGLYGIPALRPHFNIFRFDGDGYENFVNGHKNAERNIVFSTFVTSVSFYELLKPLRYLTSQEIDDNFIYCDTDSLFLKQAIRNKLPSSMFDEFKLGSWEVQHEYLDVMYVLNHKKYAYVKDGKIDVKSGGIVKDSFNLNVDFDTFIKTQFKNGATIETLKSIYNNDQVISLYPSTTVLEVGKGYRLHAQSKQYDKDKKEIFEGVKKELDEFDSDVLYIESTIGSFSITDVFEHVNEHTNKLPLAFLEVTQDKIRRML